MTTAWRSIFLTFLLTLLGAHLLLGVTIREYPAEEGLYIAPGEDGSLWFTLAGDNSLGRVSLTGDYSQMDLHLSRFESSVFGITSGPHGDLWVTDTMQGAIVRVSLDGRVLSVIPTPGRFPNMITEGPDGNLWYTQGGAQIGRLTPQGVVTDFPIPTSNSRPWAITPGPDGKLWFTEKLGNKVAKMTVTGVVTEYPLPRQNSQPLWITAGYGDDLWFTEVEGNRIGRVTTSGVLTEFELPQPNSQPSIIARGPDGNMWFTERVGRIGRISPEGVVTEFPVVSPEDNLSSLTFGPDGNIWFTLNTAFKVGRFTLGGTPGPCVPGDSVLCIDDAPGDRRFKVEVDYSTTQGGGFSGAGHAIPLTSLGVSRGGLFWFFTQDNPELLVKVLNGCSNNGKRWVYLSAGTNVGLIITVADTVTGEVHTYYNLDRTAFAPVQDTSALDCGN
jgi:streptogramin lyase